MKLYPKIEEILLELEGNIQSDVTLNGIATTISEALAHKAPLSINYICTHNSRRSQFSQVWSAVAAYYYGLDIKSYSAGVEVTACNERTVASLKRMGFKVTQKTTGSNPVYQVWFAEDASIELFSKTFDDDSCPKENFFTMMTCGHADENCPFIPGALKRIPFRFDDPKAFDDTDLEAVKYDERSLEIAQNIFYILKNTSK